MWRTQDGVWRTSGVKDSVCGGHRTVCGGHRRLRIACSPKRLSLRVGLHCIRGIGSIRVVIMLRVRGRLRPRPRGELGLSGLRAWLDVQVEVGVGIVYDRTSGEDIGRCMEVIGRCVEDIGPQGGE